MILLLREYRLAVFAFSTRVFVFDLTTIFPSSLRPLFAVIGLLVWSGSIEAGVIYSASAIGMGNRPVVSGAAATAPAIPKDDTPGEQPDVRRFVSFESGGLSFAPAPTVQNTTLAVPLCAPGATVPPPPLTGGQERTQRPLLPDAIPIALLKVPIRP